MKRQKMKDKIGRRKIVAETSTRGYAYHAIYWNAAR